MIVSIWSSETRTFSLEREGERTTLRVAGKRALVATTDELDALVRHLNHVLHGRPLRAGLAWSPEDDTALAAAFDDGAPPSDLAEQFGRSISAIEARLVRLGLMADHGGWRAFVPRGPAARNGPSDGGDPE